MNKVLSLFLIFLSLLFLSCEEGGVKYNKFATEDSQIGGGGYPGTGGGQNSNPGNGGVGIPTIEVDPTVEIRHLIEPKVDNNSDTGAYVRKLTLPKNYDGLLYIAGLNVSSLADKIVKARFYFGMNRTPVTIGATVTTAAGLTPQTNTEVLVLDLRSKPFDDIRLLYDLFDYNDYDFTGVDQDKRHEPVSYNRDRNLFCRGLKLEDDPTFVGNVTNGCKNAGDVCKYAYAKIIDKGLIKDSTQIEILPTRAQVSSSAALSYYENSHSEMLKRCLPDSGLPFLFKPGITFTYGTDNPIDGVNYVYAGPYKALETSSWQIKNAALTSTSGVFGGYLDVSTNLSSGYKSKLFPLQTQLSLGANVDHYASSNLISGKVSGNILSTPGPSYWMDGCNMRATTRATVTGDHIGSCNVSAKIEIITVDPRTGDETVVNSSKEVKLQLVKEATLNTSGENVLSTSFQSCSSSSQCGSDSCCFNNRCWSKTIVSQCMDTNTNVGNLLPGEACSSDLQCSSLCCNPGSGKCGVHDALSNPQVLCAKPFGQACIAKEWCAKETITRCYIVKTGFDAQNQVTCALRCYTSQEHGDCLQGKCVAAPTPQMPVFNPNDPARCDGAYDPSQLPINLQSP